MLGASAAALTHSERVHHISQDVSASWKNTPSQLSNILSEIIEAVCPRRWMSAQLFLCKMTTFHACYFTVRSGFSHYFLFQLFLPASASGLHVLSLLCEVTDRQTEHQPDSVPICSHRDILRVGVTLAGHQKKILNSVQMMRAQMNQIQSVEV